MKIKQLLPALLAFTAAPAFAQVGCLQDFESSPNVVSDGNFLVFGQDNFVDEPLTVIANPDPAGNGSDSVAWFIEASDTEFNYGGFTFPLPNGPIAIPDGQPRTITMQVWGDRVGDVIIKIEEPGADAPTTGDILPIDNAKNVAGEWTTLTYNLPDNIDYPNLTIIPGLDTVPAENSNWYIDNIAISSGSCDSVSAVRTLRADVATLTASPNPARGTTELTLTEGTSAISLFDAVGREVLTRSLDYTSSAGTRVQLDVSNLATGSYLAVGLAADGTVLGRARLAVEQ